MKLRTLFTPVAVAALALSACGGDAENLEVSAAPETTAAATAEETAAEGASAEESEAAPAEESPAAEESEAETTGEAPTELGPEARAALDAFLASHEGAQEIPAAQLDPSVLAEQTSGMEVEPAECKEAMNSSMDPEHLTNAVLGGAMAQDATGGSVVLTVMEYPQGSTQAKDNVQLGRENSERCSEMTLTSGGQSMQATLEPLSEQVDGADDSFLSKSTMVLGDVVQPSYTGIASKDHLSVTVAVSTPDGSLDQSAVQEVLAESIAAMG